MEKIESLKKRYKQKSSHIYGLCAALLVVVVFSLSLGWATFSKTLLIDEIGVAVRTYEEIRLTRLTIAPESESELNGAVSNWEEFTAKRIMASIQLPNESSKIKYKVGVTNYGNVDMGIQQITGLDEHLEYHLEEYQLKEKLCDRERCNLGMQKEFFITIQYKSGMYDATKTTYDLALDFEFKPFHKVSYVDFRSETSSYPQEVMDGETYFCKYLDPLPKRIEVESGKLGKPFTYQNGELTITDVTDDITITSINKVDPISFQVDDWETIRDNVSSGVYHVGEEKTVELSGLGQYTLRIANTSACEKTTDFSQTACGFVVEFKDIVTTHDMTTSGTNEGSWAESDMRTYLNGDFLNTFPKELKEVIISTTTISGHGSRDTGSGVGENFVSTEKIYLLSPGEIWGVESSNPFSDDTSWNYTRRLDYYAQENTTTSNFGPAVKLKDGIPTSWWLRGAMSSVPNRFYEVGDNGDWNNDFPNVQSGVSPAFRIG